MTIPSIHVGDVGTVFRLEIKEWDETLLDWVILDISTATTIELKFTHPNDSLITKTASFTTDGTDGQLEYKTLVGDTDLQFPADNTAALGRWGLRAKIIMPGWTGHSLRDIDTAFDVLLVD